MSSKRYTVACLAGNGIGPELIAAACRTLTEVSRLHGFDIDDVHALVGSAAVSSVGHPLPPATRAAYLEADAILVGVDGEAVVGEIESELDLRAAVTCVRFATGDVHLLSPLGEDAAEWTVERAFEIARSSRAHLTSVDEDAAWSELVDEVAARHDGVLVEHLSITTGLPAVAFETDRFDVLVTGPKFADVLTELVASTEREPRVVASGRLAAHGPGVFAPRHGDAPDIAGQGLADPSSMLLAVSLMLGEGLRERAAARTLAGAVDHARSNASPTLERLLTGVAATTRQFTDSVLSGLPAALPNTEFFRELQP